jgi:outer membrane protein assembly factor BamD (BamD/ComL family)
MNPTCLLPSICLLILALPGCRAHQVTIEEGTEPMSAPHGHIKSYSLHEALRARNYYRAWGDTELLIATLQRIITLAPDQQTLESVLYELGELYIKLEKYELAQKIWGDYVSFFPGSDRIAEARYNEFLAHYKDIRAPYHDQTRTREAYKRGESFLIEFEGETAHDQAVRDALEDCSAHLFDHEYGIADFYLHKYVYTETKSTLDATEKRIKKIYTECSPHMTAEQKNRMRVLEQRYQDSVKKHASATILVPTVTISDTHAH